MALFDFGFNQAPSRWVLFRMIQMWFCLSCRYYCGVFKPSRQPPPTKYIYRKKGFSHVRCIKGNCFNFFFLYLYM